MIWLPGVLSQGGEKYTWGRYNAAYGPKAGTAATVSRNPTTTIYAADAYTISGSSFKLESATRTQFQNLTAGKKTVNINASGSSSTSGSTLYDITSKGSVTWTQNDGSYGSQTTMRYDGSKYGGEYSFVTSIKFDAQKGTFSSGTITTGTVGRGNVIYTNQMSGDEMECRSFSGATTVRKIQVVDVSIRVDGDYLIMPVKIATVSATGSVNIGYIPYTLQHVRGDFIDDVTSANPDAYPDNGIQGDYWYVRYSDTPITWERYAVSQTAVEGSSTRATGVYNKYLKVGTEYSIENGEFAVTTTQSLRIRSSTSSITAPYTILAGGALSLQSSSQTTGDTVRGPMLGKLTKIAGSSSSMYADFIPYTIGTSKGSYIGTVKSFVPDEYPDDGEQDGYWYVKV